VHPCGQGGQALSSGDIYDLMHVTRIVEPCIRVCIKTVAGGADASQPIYRTPGPNRAMLGLLHDNQQHLYRYRSAHGEARALFFTV
jgi:hypothetical protein